MTEEKSFHETQAENRLKVGLLVPSTDTTVEADLINNLPYQITFHSARMYLSGVTVVDEERMLLEEVPRAARELKSLEPDVAVFACTSAGALYGPEGDIKLAKQIGELVGCPVVTVFGSVLESLKLVKPERLLIVTPYTEEINQRVKDAIVTGGVRVNTICGMNLVSDLDIGRVPKDNILRMLHQKVEEIKPDCIFLSCTNLRAWEILSIAVKEYNVPVLSSNFVMFRTLLKSMGYPVPDLMHPVWGNQ